MKFQGEDLSRSKGEWSFEPQGYKRAVFELITSTIFINLLSLSLPIMTLQVYDRILPSPGSGTLPVLITGVCLAIFLEAALRLSRSYTLGISGAKYEHLCACNAMSHILNAKLSKVGNYGVGEYLHRISSVNKLKEFYNGYALTVYLELGFIVLYAGLIVYISGILAVVPAFILAAFLINAVYQGRKLKRVLKSREGADDQRYNALIEILEGVHTIKALALENVFARKYETLESASSLENYRVTMETARTFNAAAVFSHLMVISVISFGAVQVMNGMLSTGGLIAVLLLSGRMMQPVQRGLGLWARYQDFVIAKDHVKTIFTTPQIKTPDNGMENNIYADGHLKAQNLCFTFDGANESILQDVDLEIKAGESVLITGAHGSGKTTLLKMLAGLYAPDQGDVVLNGLALKEYPLHKRPDYIGYIGTDSLIFRGTIRDNITSFGRVPEAQAQAVATMFQLEKDISRLSAGFDTLLSGTDTDGISPGLKQRISMVRALSAKPRFILFDNADRALDKHGYDLVFKILAQLKGRASMVLVSSDKNIQSLADRSFFIQSAKLHEIQNMNTQTGPNLYKELPL